MSAAAIHTTSSAGPKYFRTFNFSSFRVDNFQDCANYIAKRPYLAEAFRIDLLVRLLLETNHEIDGIYRIKVKIGEEVGVLIDFRTIAFEILNQDVCYLLLYFLFCHVKTLSAR